jgi:hypothetical protein
MKQILCSVLVSIVVVFSSLASATVTPDAGGYRVSYSIDLSSGTSNGSDINDILIFEWNAAGAFSVEPGSAVAGRGRTVLSHVIGFEPTAALVVGWGAAIPGVGDEKDHIFTLVSSSAATEFTGKNWSEAFPGIPPVPRTGHSAMVGQLQAAAAGDATALAAITEFVQREASGSAFNPAGGFRILEWSTAQPIDPPAQVPVMPTYGLWFLVLGLAALAWRFGIQTQKRL